MPPVGPLLRDWRERQWHDPFRCCIAAGAGSVGRSPSGAPGASRSITFDGARTRMWNARTTCSANSSSVRLLVNAAGSATLRHDRSAPHHPSVDQHGFESQLLPLTPNPSDLAPVEWRRAPAASADSTGRRSLRWVWVRRRSRSFRCGNRRFRCWRRLRYRSGCLRCRDPFRRSSGSLSVGSSRRLRALACALGSRRLVGLWLGRVAASA